MPLSPQQSGIAIFVGLFALLVFFSSVNLTQKQAVISMGACIIAGLCLWFWKQPWK